MIGFCGSKLKFLLILAVLVFMNSFHSMLSSVEHEKSFIALGTGLPF